MNTPKETVVFWLPRSFKADRWRSGWYYTDSDNGAAVGVFASAEIATFFARKAGFGIAHVVDQAPKGELTNKPMP